MNDIRMITILHSYGFSHRHINRMIAWKNLGLVDTLVEECAS